MTTPSNEEVGKALGVSHAAVSRYKSGNRFPEMDTLARIAKLLDWSMDDQYAAQQNGTYASEFTDRVAACVALGAVVEDASPDQQGCSR